MSPILEGKEVEKKFDGEAGLAIVDVDAKGGVVISLSYNKEVDLDGYAKAKAAVSLSAESNVISILEKLAAKTGAKWDDSVVATIKTLLNMLD